MSDYNSKSVKVLTYWYDQMGSFVGENKPYPSRQQFMNRAVSDLIEKLIQESQK